ncbi:hydrogenase maturation nickel metallochaperone HypA/HybF [Saccharopolyspora phatthalungensis]|uniref:Hydrogenase maturation factor HypA n=1 Tax=Saccharopolyspora phatthalungensis TaxID=664693 RepID=A0A840QES2_9PSEU|nr:hydrogenase maturation nickel metallochaperone HypA [Saccharopolyspora phatthalungensis]MBB5157089.1 hydrogenase nickel incorporation protein HypA/HybF [Saccharopolyspora phatthalungensis]
MHELAITQGVVEAISHRIGEGRVVAVRLQIGKSSGVVADSVRFCFGPVTEGTILEGARLDIDEPVGQCCCRTCGEVFEPDPRFALCACGSADVEVRSGQELRILSVEVV